MLPDNVSKYPPLNHLNFEEDFNELLCAERIYGTTKSVYNALHITVDLYFFSFKSFISSRSKKSIIKENDKCAMHITINTSIRMNKILSTVKIRKSRREALHNLQSLQIQSLHKDLG